MLFFCLFFCRYFYNSLFRLQELASVETLVKILYFAFPQVPKHFHCIVCFLVLCSIQFVSPPIMRGLISRRKTGTVSVEVFTFHVHLAFERHTGTEGRELYFRAVFILKKIPLPFELIFLQQCNKIYRLTSKNYCFDVIHHALKTVVQTKLKHVVICCTCRHWKRHNRLMKWIISSLQFFSMFSDL